jgi:hypothetical protein
VGGDADEDLRPGSEDEDADEDEDEEEEMIRRE